MRLLRAAFLVGAVLSSPALAQSGNNADGLAPIPGGLSLFNTFPYVWNGTGWDRVYGDKTNGVWVNCKSGCGAAPSNQTVNVTQFGGTNISTGTGVGGAGVPRVTVSSDSFPATQAVTQSTSPWVDNLTQWASVTLGAATAWGTAPTGNVPGVNANILGPLGQQLSAASIPVVLPAAQITTLTPPTSVTANGAANVTATPCSGTITSGGAAQNAFTAQTTLHGFTIANIDTTEPLWISFTTTAAAAGTDSYPLPAATATTYAGFGSFTAPPGFGLNHALSVIAATTNHKFTCTWW